MRALVPDVCDEVVVLGAHCDDIAIGAGGTLLAWCLARPGLRVRALVLSGGGTARETEEHAALAALCPDADLEVTVLDLPDGRFPTHWERAKDALEEFRRGCEPDLVLAPSEHDHHQDHRGLARLVPTVFRDHLVLGYEILKAEADLRQPLVFVPLTTDVLSEKCRVLHASYPSQASRTWFDDETFRGLARVRGVQGGHHYAEGFHPVRLSISPIGHVGGDR
ncbi:PIG-L deacetylase family protein [Nocardioides sp.]|uniref:PIG-L deacetylase family protein n=1 Tax=Nocardioides sp. TaxID=35761 RepID=UPI002B2736BD|nr:PIG-L deacetylase family protein [Nocardioides sp.]